MKLFSRSLLSLAAISLVVYGGLLASAAGPAFDSFEGRWDATVTIKENVIPFRLDISGKGTQLTGTLFNGDQTQTTTSARGENGEIVLNFEHYLTKITATLKEGQLDGTVEGRFDRERYISSFPFHAKRYSAHAAYSGEVPKIDGLWEIPYESPKGEKAWRFIVRQSGADVSATILRVDGDTGALTGTYRDGKFILSHFDGARPLVLEVTATKEGTLNLHQNGAYTNRSNLTAYRPKDARAKGLPEPADFKAHTTVRDPKEVFAFSFPDLSGKLVSSNDARFKGKVVVAVVTGTWCPNCHDEAQYLVKLYKQYHDKGLEIVALNFEEPEQQDELIRARAFVKQYGVPYPYLIAGAPVEMWEKVPQAVNLNTWPATLFIGRDGLVKSIHAGFAAPASGEFHQKLKEEFTSTVARLLGEDVATTAQPSTRAGRR